MGIYKFVQFFPPVASLSTCALSNELMMFLEIVTDRLINEDWHFGAKKLCEILFCSYLTFIFTEIIYFQMGG